MKKYITKFLILVLVLSFLVVPNYSGAQTGDVDPEGPTSSCVKIENNLRYRDRDSLKNGEVSTLQDFLQSQGYLKSEPTGYFGLLTFKAVKEFQKANGTSPTGYVGPITRAKIKTITCDEENPIPLPTPLPTPVPTPEPAPIPLPTPVPTPEPAPIPLPTPVPINHKPVIGEISQPINIYAGQPAVFTFNATDEDKDYLSWSVYPGEGARFPFACPSSVYRNSGNWSYKYSHTWNKAGTYKMSVSVIDCNGGATGKIFDVVVKDVPIITPAITVTSPNGGESLNRGTTKNIEWTNSQVLSCPINSSCFTNQGKYNIYLEYIYECNAPSGGACITLAGKTYTIAENLYGSSYGQSKYPWVVGQILENSIIVPGKYKIKVCQENNCDISDSTFNIN